MSFENSTIGVGIFTILIALVAAGVLLVLGYDTAGQIVFLIGFFAGFMVLLYPSLFPETKSQTQTEKVQHEMEDFRKRLSVLIAEGTSVVQSIESTSFIISFGRVVLPYILKEEELDDVSNFIESLNLPSPVHQVYVRYIQWNRDCETFFSDFGLEKSFQFGEFVRIRREASKEISRENPDQRRILLKIKDQLSIVDSLSKLNLAKLQKEIPQKKTRRKQIFVLAYVLICLIADAILFLKISFYVIGVMTLEAAILFGSPKLLEWLRS
jgi:Ca2+/Na+ antiporter